MSPLPPAGPASDSRLGRLLARTLLRRGRATTLLLVAAYATAVVGLGLSLFAGAGGNVRTAGIALMFVAFACLFVASLRIVDTTGADADAAHPSRRQE
jgi:hypothetical protein